MTEHPITVRLDDATIARLERIAEVMGMRAGGVTLKRGTVVRAAVEHGMESLERGAGPGKKETVNNTGGRRAFTRRATP